MNYATPQYSPRRVDAAGDFFIGYDKSTEDTLMRFRAHDAYLVVNNWRASHSFPLNTFQVGLKSRAQAIDSNSIAAQRIKRLSSIEAKLTRFAWLKLSAMQDIGGCRAVMSSVHGVRKLVSAFEVSGIKHTLDDCDDYIQTPKRSGYRGVHLIYKYHSDRKETYNGLTVEIQIRSLLQHAWATAVETVGTFTKQALKSSAGEKDWLRFFALMGSAIAYREKCPLVPETPTTKTALRVELRELLTKLDVEVRLRAYGEALDIVSKDLKNAHHFLVNLNSTTKRVDIYGFKAEELEHASEEYVKLENESAIEQQGDAVLVSVESLATLKKAYPNYFLDTSAFLDAVKEAIRS